ncbi:MAG: response regulator [Methylacidiphilales bacterium]|nr:response regulator [Candidatus Methylacidiphilales bacterium]
MTVLIADDLAINRKLLRSILTSEGYNVIEAVDGIDALTILQANTVPIVGLIDWEMPGIEGIEVCRQARSVPPQQPFYLILVTVRDSKQDTVAGLNAGANDYITKPFDRTELQARVRIGSQMLELQQSLTQHVKELKEALLSVKQLSGLLPICSYCKKIRDDQNYWQQVEAYVGKHTEAKFSHSICPQCYEEIVKPQMIQLGVEP